MSELREKIAAVVARMPEWLRRDLLSDDPVAKEAAQEALTAMIANAIADAPST